MITIEYCEEGTAVSDFDTEKWLDEVKKTHNGYFKISTSLPIDIIRLAIVKNELFYEDISFKYKDHLFKANKYGRLEVWPKGFCTIQMDIIEELLGLVSNMRVKNIFN